MSNSPPPGSPPPIAPPAGDPSQEDRLLAAAAYLGYVTGFWVIVPVIIYVFRRDKSRFVAHHAIRALILHVAAVPLGIVCALVAAGAGVALMVGMGERGGRGHEGTAAGIMVFVVWGSWLIPFVAYFVITVLAAIAAFQGRMNTSSWLGRATEWFVRQDTTVAK